MDSPIWGMTTSTRATASPSLVVGAGSAATEKRDGYGRHDHRSDERATKRVCRPTTRRARLRFSRAAGQRADDLGNQYRDHAAAGEADERRETADPNILPPAGVRRSNSLLLRHRSSVRGE